MRLRYNRQFHAKAGDEAKYGDRSFSRIVKLLLLNYALSIARQI
jgi:hypothetical protein